MESGLKYLALDQHQKARCYTPLILQPSNRKRTSIHMGLSENGVPQNPHGISWNIIMFLYVPDENCKVGADPPVLGIRIYPALQASISEMVSVGSSRRQVHFLRAEV